MNEVSIKKIDFNDIYNRAYRLAAAVFMVSGVIEKDEEIKTKIKTLSLDLVSLSVNLKDTHFGDSKKLISDIQKKSLELISMLDIASVSGLISKMNGEVIKAEFLSFLSQIEEFDENKDVSVKNIFIGQDAPVLGGASPASSGASFGSPAVSVKPQSNGKSNGHKAHNGLKRKDVRKNTILDFIKGHDSVSIKDIVPNVTGCSEKTIQRELIDLIKEGKIKKVGERRWSKYSAV